jgi:hypothetical protein
MKRLYLWYGDFSKRPSLDRFVVKLSMAIIGAGLLLTFLNHLN